MKRKFITGALLTTVVVGAALLGNAQPSRILIKSGVLNSTGTNCVNRDLNCEPDPGTPCTVTGLGQVYQSNLAGTQCNVFLSEIGS